MDIRRRWPMQTPALPAPDARGQRWLQTQVRQILAAAAVPLAAPRAEGEAVCYWGMDSETNTTLYFLLAGDPEPKALPFRPTMIAQCGSGLSVAQHNAIIFI